MHTCFSLHIDLHIHSCCSDGVLRPADLVARAKAAGLSVIAVADHDTVAGVPEAQAEGLRLGVEIIPAVELSVRFRKWDDVHLLGYGIDVSDPGLLTHLERFRANRSGRNVLILERVNRRLARQGYCGITLEKVLAFAGGVLGRPHIARALIEEGIVGTVEQAFQNYLIPCNVPKEYWPIHDAIAEIHRTGGAAVLAHPTSITRDRGTLAEIISSLAANGLDGIEVCNNMASTEDMGFLEDLAGSLGLVATAGSDYHGIEDGIEMGRGRDGIRFDGSLLAPLKERFLSRQDQLRSL